MKRMIEDSVLFDIGDALREKHNTDRKYQDNEMAQAVRDIQSEDDSLAVGLIQRDIAEIAIPETITKIGAYAFCKCTNLTKVLVPDSVTVIDSYAFDGCSKLSEINLPEGIVDIGIYCFRGTVVKEFIIPSTCVNVRGTAFFGSGAEKIIVSNGVKSIDTNAFATDTLKELFLPNTLNFVRKPIDGAVNLEKLVLEDGFDCNNLDVYTRNYGGNRTYWAREDILSWFNALADRTGKDAYKLIIGAENIAKLTEEDIAIATAKNWTIS